MSDLRRATAGQRPFAFINQGAALDLTDWLASSHHTPPTQLAVQAKRHGLPRDWHDPSRL